MHDFIHLIYTFIFLCVLDVNFLHNFRVFCIFRQSVSNFLNKDFYNGLELCFELNLSLKITGVTNHIGIILYLEIDYVYNEYVTYKMKK